MNSGKTYFPIFKPLVTFKFTITLLIFSFIFFLIEVNTGLDVVVLLYSNHSTFFDKSLPVFVMLLVGIVIDVIIIILQKNRIRQLMEKQEIYRATIFGMQHLLLNLLHNFSIIQNEPFSNEIKKLSLEEYELDIIELLEKSFSEVEEIIDSLSILETIEPEIIKKISVSNTFKHASPSEGLEIDE